MSLTFPKPDAKDQRIAFVNHKISHDGIVWRVTGRANVYDGKIHLKVHRLEGDVNKPAELKEALAALAAEIDYRLMPA